MPKFATPILDAAIERDRHDREVLRTELILKVFEALGELNKSVPFKKAYLFGSIVKPYAFTSLSDVDVAFTGLEDAHFFKAISFLSRYLNRDVDVIQLDGHRLSEKIRRTGIPWIRKD